MIKKILIFLLIIITVLVISSEFAFPQKMMEMAELINPTSMAIDGSGLFIVDGPAVLLYSLKKSKLVKKIGQEGDGPGEFRIAPNLPITVNLHQSKLYVSSLGKISVFSTDGHHLKEIRNKSLAVNLIPCSNRFVGKGFAQAEGKRFNTVNIYDENLNKILEIYREKGSFQGFNGGKFDPVDATGPPLAAAGQRLYLNAGRNRNTFFIYGLNGEKLNAITHAFKKIRLTQGHIDRYMDYLESDPDFKNFVARTKHLFKFNDVFPMVQNFFIDGGNLFVTSYENENGKRDLYVFTVEGKFLKHLEIPLVSQNVDNPYPFTIFNGKVYQIVEEEDAERWGLFVHHIISSE